jgi:EF hand
VRRTGITIKIGFALWLVAGLVALPPTTGQELKEPKLKKSKSEKLSRPEKPNRPEKPIPDKSDKLADKFNKLSDKEDKIIFATAKLAFGAETERDRWIKVMAEVRPGSTVPDARGEIDFARWYDAVCPDQPSWSLQAIREKPLKELHLRASQRLNLGREPISREAFLAYAVQNLTAGNSPPWKAPNPEVDPFDAAAKIFNGMDKNKSGALEESEQTESLRAVAEQFDANRNGALEYEEYREYFGARLGGYRENPTSLAAGPPEPRAAPKGEPSGESKSEPAIPLPKWYRELDEDRDGQVGLYEWRSAGQRPLGEFATIDRDGDGLLTPYELQQLSKSEPQSPYLKGSLPSIPSQYLHRPWR